MRDRFVEHRYDKLIPFSLIFVFFCSSILVILIHPTDYYISPPRFPLLQETDGGNAQPRSSNTRGPNSQQSVTKGIYDLGQEVFDRLRAGLEGAGQSLVSDFLLQLQSYLSWGNWEELLARIQARKENRYGFS